MTHDHNHDASERRVDTAKAIELIREKAQTSNDKPSRIRLDVLATVPEESREVI